MLCLPWGRVSIATQTRALGPRRATIMPRLGFLLEDTPQMFKIPAYDPFSIVFDGGRHIAGSKAGPLFLSRQPRWPTARKGAVRGTSADARRLQCLEALRNMRWRISVWSVIELLIGISALSTASTSTLPIESKNRWT